jgi:hypothetical protein
MFPVLHLLDADRVVKYSGLLAGWHGTGHIGQVGSSCAGRISGAHPLAAGGRAFPINLRSPAGVDKNRREHQLYLCKNTDETTSSDIYHK